MTEKSSNDKNNQLNKQQNANPPLIPDNRNMNTFFSPMEKKINFFNVIETLLKTPGKVIYELREHSSSHIIALLFLIIISCMIIYGFVTGIFSGGAQLFYSAIKLPSGLILSGLICFPSLYIFLALSGIDIKLRDSLGFLFCALAISSILLVGFAPVLWIFSESTNSLVFMGILHICFWLIAAYLGIRLLGRSISLVFNKKQNILIIWFIIFMLVSFQMSTTLRPIIGSSNKIIPTEKKFFLNHWSECLRNRPNQKTLGK